LRTEVKRLCNEPLATERRQKSVEPPVSESLCDTL
jgi:hypothetical protein